MKKYAPVAEFLWWFSSHKHWTSIGGLHLKFLKVSDWYRKARAGLPRPGLGHWKDNMPNFWMNYKSLIVPLLHTPRWLTKVVSLSLAMDENMACSARAGHLAVAHRSQATQFFCCSFWVSHLAYSRTISPSYHLVFVHTLHRLELSAVRFSDGRIAALHAKELMPMTAAMRRGWLVPKRCRGFQPFNGLAMRKAKRSKGKAEMDRDWSIWRVDFRGICNVPNMSCSGSATWKLLV